MDPSASIHGLSLDSFVEALGEWLKTPSVGTEARLRKYFGALSSLKTDTALTTALSQLGTLGASIRRALATNAVYDVENAASVPRSISVETPFSTPSDFPHRVRGAAAALEAPRLVGSPKDDTLLYAGWLVNGNWVGSPARAVLRSITPADVRSSLGLTSIDISKFGIAAQFVPAAGGARAHLRANFTGGTRIIRPSYCVRTGATPCMVYVTANYAIGSSQPKEPLDNITLTPAVAGNPAAPVTKIDMGPSLVDPLPTVLGEQMIRISRQFYRQSAAVPEAVFTDCIAFPLDPGPGAAGGYAYRTVSGPTYVPLPPNFTLVSEANIQVFAYGSDGSIPSAGSLEMHPADRDLDPLSDTSRSILALATLTN